MSECRRGGKRIEFMMRNIRFTFTCPPNTNFDEVRAYAKKKAEETFLSSPEDKEAVVAAVRKEMAQYFAKMSPPENTQESKGCIFGESDGGLPNVDEVDSMYKPRTSAQLIGVGKQNKKLSVDSAPSQNIASCESTSGDGSRSSGGGDIAVSACGNSNSSLTFNMSVPRMPESTVNERATPERKRALLETFLCMMTPTGDQDSERCIAQVYNRIPDLKRHQVDALEKLVTKHPDPNEIHTIRPFLETLTGITPSESQERHIRKYDDMNIARK